MHSLRSIVEAVWRYQRGIHKLQIEGGQATQWPKSTGQNDKQWSAKH